jgi:hypothetical protein
MEFRNVSEFHVQAEKCFHRSQLTDDRASKLHWLFLAEVWLLLSENMSKQDFQETFGVKPEFCSLPSHDTQH